ncbi:MAG: tyrosine-type recombinase/integrase [Proteobacteria bacterium]|nr:tyrosine-type recombinase/integrase [Pseudomonadota bacterium]
MSVVGADFDPFADSATELVGFPALLEPGGTEPALSPETLDNLRAARSDATKRAYRSDWRVYKAWCQARGVPPIPASEVSLADFLSELAAAGRKVTSLNRMVASIRFAHRIANVAIDTQTPLLREVRRGIRQRRGVKRRKVNAIVVAELHRILDEIPADLRGLRDRALLLLGFAGAFRRSELAYLDVEDVGLANEGLRIELRKSKTDQAGRGTMVGIPYGGNVDTCPVRAVEAWLDAAGITTGPLFRGVAPWPDRESGVFQLLETALDGKSIARIVKRRAGVVGIEATAVSGHSLRRGFITQAVRLGLPDRTIMRQSRHRSRASMDEYVAEEGAFVDNAAERIGL